MGHFQCASSRPHCHLGLEWRSLPIQCTNRNKYWSETLCHQRYASSVYLKKKLNVLFQISLLISGIEIPINGVHNVKMYIPYSILCTCTCIWILWKYINIGGKFSWVINFLMVQGDEVRWIHLSMKFVLHYWFGNDHF